MWRQNATGQLYRLVYVIVLGSSLVPNPVLQELYRVGDYKTYLQQNVLSFLSWIFLSHRHADMWHIAMQMYKT